MECVCLQIESRVTDDAIESTLSVNAGGKSIILFNRKDPANPGKRRIPLSVTLSIFICP
jgi:hypothetical protein